jgi:DNA-binding NarL/FixJ family response regulator
MLSTRILLVDDNPEFLESAARFLSADPNITVAGHALSGQEALKQITRLAPDLVLMDLAMPDMSGLEVTQRIKTQTNPPYVIILTLHDNPEYRAAAKDVGADGFIAKSEFGTNLCPLIHRILGRDSIPPQEKAKDMDNVSVL